jgi:enamine deaminase RidA (YjgF/YER057c/UK114 family)
MQRRLISSGSSYEKTVGYSRAVVDGEWVFVSGTTGMDYKAMTIEPGVVAQTRQTLKNIGVALAEAGAGFTDVVRLHYYFTDAADFPKVAPVLGEVFGDVRPAATAVICQLVDPRMKIEIEVTARRKA